MPTDEQIERVKKSFNKYDGDACRPEYGFNPQNIAELSLKTHWDVATCFCPTCVLARIVLGLVR